MRIIINCAAAFLILGVMWTLSYLMYLTRDLIIIEAWIGLGSIVIMTAFFGVAGILLLCQWAKENLDGEPFDLAENRPEPKPRPKHDQQFGRGIRETTVADYLKPCPSNYKQPRDYLDIKIMARDEVTVTPGKTITVELPVEHQNTYDQKIDWGDKTIFYICPKCGEKDEHHFLGCVQMDNGPRWKCNKCNRFSNAPWEKSCE